MLTNYYSFWPMEGSSLQLCSMDAFRFCSSLSLQEPHCRNGYLALAEMAVCWCAAKKAPWAPWSSYRNVQENWKNEQYRIVPEICGCVLSLPSMSGLIPAKRTGKVALLLDRCSWWILWIVIPSIFKLEMSLDNIGTSFFFFLLAWPIQVHTKMAYQLRIEVIRRPG